MDILKNRYTADFETDTTQEDKTFVWAWATCNIKDENKIKLGSSISSFMDFCFENRWKVLFS